MVNLIKKKIIIKKEKLVFSFSRLRINFFFPEKGFLFFFRSDLLVIFFPKKVVNVSFLFVKN